METVLPLDTHPRENSPFKSERHLLQPPCVFCFFVFCSLLCSSVWESGRESVGEKAHGSGRAWQSVSLVRRIFFFTFFFIFHICHAKPAAGDDSVTGWRKLFFPLSSFFSRPAGASLQDYGKIHVAPVKQSSYACYLRVLVCFYLVAVKVPPQH